MVDFGLVDEPSDNAYLRQQFVDDIKGSKNGGQWFLGLLDEWARVEQRTFTFNIVNVTVNFAEGWAVIADVLEADATHRLPLDDLRRLAA